ncbi:unnamed protein product, partial [Adineta ricciae]
MNHSTKVSAPIRSVFVKQWEGTRKTLPTSRTSPLAIVDTSFSSSSSSSSSSPIPFHSKKSTHPAEPIIICERITNHNRVPAPSVSPKTWSQLKYVSQQHLESIECDSDSAIHTLVTVIEHSNHDCVTLSRSSTSGTSDSTCSSTCSSSSSPPRFARPTIASSQKQRQAIYNSSSFKRTSSPPSSIPTFTRAISSPVSTTPSLFSIHEDLEQQQQSSPQTSTIATCFCSSESDSIVDDDYCELSATDTIRSDKTILLQNSLLINTNLPLRYKRDSFIRLYGPDLMQQHGHHIANEIVLEDDIDPPFSPRAVTVKKNRLVADEYELMEILGRGKFGEVKKCREKSTQHLLAAKFIQINKEQDRIEALNEIDIMKSLQHPRLLQLYDAFETKGNFCLIMELINGGELFERVIDDDFILTERLCELYMMQICEGVSFMHSCNIIHL